MDGLCFLVEVSLPDGLPEGKTLILLRADYHHRKRFALKAVTVSHLTHLALDRTFPNLGCRRNTECESGLSMEKQERMLILVTDG